MSGLVGVLLGLSAVFAARAVKGSGRRVLAGLIPTPTASMKLAGTLRAHRGDVRLWRTASARRSAEDQLADAVRAISAGLRAGLSIPQSLAYALQEAQPPLRDSLATLVDSIQMGVPVEQGLDSWAQEAGSDDARLLAGVLRLHRRSGGQLPAVLDQVAATLRARRAAALEVGALTAQARLSGTILGFLPIGFFAFLWLTSRSQIQGAFHNSTGIWSVSIGLLMDAAAFLWIRRLLRVK